MSKRQKRIYASFSLLFVSLAVFFFSVIYPQILLGFKTYTTVGIKTVYIDAGAMVPNTTSGCQFATNEYTTYDIDLDYGIFVKASETYATFKFPAPEDWDLGAIKAKFYWTGANGCSEDDLVEWEIGCIAVGNGDTIDDDIYAATQVISDASSAGVDGAIHLSGATPAITVQGTPAVGDMIICKCSRNIGSENDDMAESAWLFGVWIQYSATQSVTKW